MMNYKEMMEALENYKRKRVRVEFVNSGKLVKVAGILEDVQRFRHIRLSLLPDRSLPDELSFISATAKFLTQETGRQFWIILDVLFIGSFHAIIRVIGENGKVLYENPSISPDYSLSEIEELDRAVIETFGNFGKEALEEIRGYEEQACEEGKIVNHAERIEDWQLARQARIAIKLRKLQIMVGEKTE